MKKETRHSHADIGDFLAAEISTIIQRRRPDLVGRSNAEIEKILARDVNRAAAQER